MDELDGYLYRERQKKYVLFLAIVIVALLVVAIGVTSCFSGKKSKKSSEVNSSGNIDKSSAGELETEEKEDEEQKLTIKYPDKGEQYQEITSEAVLSPYVAVVDVTDNQLVAGRNAETRIYPASMTKVMTLIVAVEHIQDLDQTFTMTSEIIDPLVKDSASRAGFDPGEVVTARDLLYGLILPSGADGAVGLANMVSGSEEAFVGLMNEKCEELGLENTHFMNTSGLHDENHYTTPTEMAMILEYAMKNETCAQFLSTYQYTTAPTEQHPEGILLTSTMFSRMYGNEVPGVTIVGGKTGYTQEAKNCLVSFAQSNGKDYVAVTAGADNRWNVIYDDFELYKDFTDGGLGASQSGQEIQTNPEDNNAQDEVN